jgi:hypothetical protein
LSCFFSQFHESFYDPGMMFNDIFLFGNIWFQVVECSDTFTGGTAIPFFQDTSLQGNLTTIQNDLGGMCLREIKISWLLKIEYILIGNFRVIRICPCIKMNRKWTDSNSCFLCLASCL